ncbi:MAG: fumarylacetoacetate hydrolase family protein [Acidimicrobiales bacterium]
MELVTIRHNGGTRAGRIEQDVIVLLDAPTVKEVLTADGGLGGAATADGGETVAVADADLAPVVPRPDKIVCVGVNYRDHIAEMGREVPGHPTYFAKYARALVGPNDEIVLPPADVSTSIDWECELALVIGRSARNVSGADALAAIAGFCVLNDVSVRDWQRRTTQFLAGKTFEGLTPIGPSLVTSDQVGDGSGLALSTTVNGVVKQESNTSHLVFNAVDIVSDLSRVMTLDPGDVIATGTPGGVGAARTPPEYLKPGDELVTTIEGLGRLVNRCR